MVDIFLSYERDDQSRVRVLVDALRARGYRVWWDAGMLRGEGFAGDIAEVIGSARLVVTLWTLNSVQSEQVVAESELAHGQSKYLGVLLDAGAAVPAPFNEMQAARMTGRDLLVKDLDLLCAVIGAEIGSPAPFESAEVNQQQADTADAEAAIWSKVRQGDTASGYEFYLQQYDRIGVFADEARQRLRKVTSVWSRGLARANSGLAKATMLAVIVGSGMVGYSMVREDTVSATQYTVMDQFASRVQKKLSAERSARIGLTAALENSVGKAEYLALSEQTGALQHQLAQAETVSERLSTKLANAQIDAALQIASLESDLSDVTRARDQLQFAFNNSFGNDKVAAIARAFACSSPGASDDGVSFGGRCWSRDTAKLELNGADLGSSGSLAPVAALHDLEWLDVTSSEVDDLTPLSSLKKLRVLDLAQTPVESVVALAGMSALETLDLSGTNVSDLSPLLGLSNLKTLCPASDRCTVDDGPAVRRYLKDHSE